MRRFSPGPQVPPSDFPKVFVAFCKRFRGKAKDEGLYFDENPDSEAFADGGSSSAGGGGRSSTGHRRGKRSGGGSKVMGQVAETTECTGSSAGIPPSSTPQNDAALRSSLSKGGVVPNGDLYPTYASPGSTPRSDMGEPSPTTMSAMGLSTHRIPSRQMPVGYWNAQQQTMVCPSRPQMPNTPVSPLCPPHGMPVLPPGMNLYHQGPPPPMHVPRMPDMPMMGSCPMHSLNHTSDKKAYQFSRGGPFPQDPPPPTHQPTVSGPGPGGGMYSWQGGNLSET